MLKLAKPMIYFLLFVVILASLQSVSAQTLVSPLASPVPYAHQAQIIVKHHAPVNPWAFIYATWRPAWVYSTQ